MSVGFLLGFGAVATIGIGLLVDTLGNQVAAAADPEQRKNAFRDIDEGPALQGQNQVEAGDDEGKNQELEARQARFTHGFSWRRIGFLDDPFKADLVPENLVKHHERKTEYDDRYDHRHPRRQVGH